MHFSNSLYILYLQETSINSPTNVDFNNMSSDSNLSNDLSHSSGVSKRIHKTLLKSNVQNIKSSSASPNIVRNVFVSIFSYLCTFKYYVINFKL